MKSTFNKTLFRATHVGRVCAFIGYSFWMMGSVYAFDKETKTQEEKASVEWSYSGETGPEFWGDLSPDFIACKAGLEQSPVDLSGAQVVEGKHSLKSVFKPTPLVVTNNGHTIQVDMDNGSYTKTDSDKKRLLQFHFHSKSEHTVNGQSFPLEAHFVHIDELGVLSVLGVLFEIGDENKTLKKILSIAPDHKGTAKSDRKIKPAKLLGENQIESYYQLKGSLTTPPCSEGVNWYVSTDVQSLSSEQYQRFQTLFHHGNARPVQPLNQRNLTRIEED